MSRDWVKLHTCILHDPGINSLSAESGWNWTRMLALAGDNEDGGRIGDVRTVAYVLRVDEASIERTVVELDGRIVERDGQLWFRDWDEWQSASNRERQAAFKLAHRADPALSERAVTSGNEAKQPVTGSNASNAPRARARPDQTRPEEKRPEETRTATTPVPVAAAATCAPAATGAAVVADARASAGTVRRNGHKPEPQPRASPVDRAWGPFEEAVSKALGGLRVVNAKNGRPLAWVGELCDIAGRNAEGDVRQAVSLWEDFTLSDEWRFRPRDMGALPAAFGAWVAASRRPPPGRETEDPSWRMDRIITQEEHDAQGERLRALGLIR